MKQLTKGRSFIAYRLNKVADAGRIITPTLHLNDRLVTIKVDFSLITIWISAIFAFLTHWGRETHICVSKLTIIGSDNGLSPSRRQTIIWTNDGILLIGPLGTNFKETSIEIHTFSFKKIYLKLSSAKWRLFCVGLNVLIHGWFNISPNQNCINSTISCWGSYAYSQNYHGLWTKHGHPNVIMDTFMCHLILWAKLSS